MHEIDLEPLCAGTTKDQVCIKLVNDGFVYISKPGRRRTRHNTSTSQQPGALCVGLAILFARF